MRTASAESLDEARMQGDLFAQRAMAHAEDQVADFRDRAREFVLRYLALHGPSSGEDVTDAAIEDGIAPSDARSFGAIYAWLNKYRHIRCVGIVARKKGHGTAGGRIWDINLDTPPQGTP